MRVCRQRVPVGDKEQAVIFMLHLQKAFYGSEIISQMEISGRSDATYYSFHIYSIYIVYFSDGGKDSNKYIKNEKSPPRLPAKSYICLRQT